MSSCLKDIKERLTTAEEEIVLLNNRLHTTKNVLLDLIEDNAQSIIDNNNSIMVNHEYIVANNDSIVANSQQIIDNFLSLTEDLVELDSLTKVKISELQHDIVESQEYVLELLQAEVDALEDDIAVLGYEDADLLKQIEALNAELETAIASLGRSISATNSYISSSVSSLNNAIAAVPDVCDIDGEVEDSVNLPAYIGDVGIVVSYGDGTSETLYVARFGTKTHQLEAKDGYWRLLDSDGRFDGGFYSEIENLPFKQTVTQVAWLNSCGDGCDINQWLGPGYESNEDKMLGLEFAPEGTELTNELKYEWNPTTGFYRGCIDGASEVKWYVNGEEVSTNITLIQDIADKNDNYLVTAKAKVDGVWVWAQHIVKHDNGTSKARTRRGKVKVRRPV